MSSDSKLDFNALGSNMNLVARNYWKNRLSGVELNRFFSYQNNVAHAAAKVFAEDLSLAPSGTYEEFIRIAETDIARHMVLLSTLAILAEKYSNVPDVVVFTPLYNDGIADGASDPIIPVRINASPELTFQALIAALKNNFVSDFNHGNYPVEKMFGNEVSDLSAAPITGLLLEGLHTAGTLEQWQPDLIFTLSTKDALVLKIRYNIALFSKEYIRQIAAHFFNLLLNLICEPKKPVSEISILSPEELHGLVYECNDSHIEYPADKTIVDLFDEQVIKTPDTPALSFGDTTLDYKHLKELSVKMALYLQETGIAAGERVGVLLDREEYLIVSILGILRAGCAYVPIDTGYPSDRINYIIENAGLKALVTRRGHLHSSIAADIQIIDLDTVSDIIKTKPVMPVNNHFIQNGLAYVIYTSGSTGKPKGVQVGHSAVINYISFAVKNYIKKENPAFALFTSIAFDLTVTSIFTPLVTGGRIIIYPKKDSGILIEEVIADNKADIVKLTPSHLSILKNNGVSKAIPFRKMVFIVGGEDLKTELAKEIHSFFEGAVEIYNEYGPTEATVGCMICKFNLQESATSVPIGKPIQNTQIYVLNQYLQPVPANVIGELYISGDCLAHGYLYNEDLTQQRFIDNPFIPGKKMYKSGDLAVRRHDGSLLFMGRIDDQVKINGYRIEPGEIATELSKHELINEAVVIVQERAGEKFLAAYYVSDQDIGSADLRAFLSNELPEYMIPGNYIRIAQIPLTPNGKLNRKALPDVPVAGIDHGGENDTHKALIAIWADILNADPRIISIHAGFYSIGGNSLKMLRMVSRVNNHFNIKIPVAKMFELSNISSIANYLNQTAQSLPDIPEVSEPGLQQMNEAFDLFNQLRK